MAAVYHFVLIAGMAFVWYSRKGQLWAPSVYCIRPLSLRYACIFGQCSFFRQTARQEDIKQKAKLKARDDEEEQPTKTKKGHARDCLGLPEDVWRLCRHWNLAGLVDMEVTSHHQKENKGMHRDQKIIRSASCIYVQKLARPSILDT